MNKNICEVNILGTKYAIDYLPQTVIDKLMHDNEHSGFCDEILKRIGVSLFDDDDSLSDEKRTAIMSLILRHEIIHAFLNESGLSWDSFNHTAWAKNEEMIGWMSIQIPKISKVYEQLDIL